MKLLLGITGAALLVEFQVLRTFRGLKVLRSGDPRKGKLSQRKIPQPSDDVCSTFFVFSLLRMNSHRFKTKNAVPYGRHFSLAESGGFEPADL